MNAVFWLGIATLPALAIVLAAAAWLLVGARKAWHAIHTHLLWQRVELPPDSKPLRFAPWNRSAEPEEPYRPTYEEEANAFGTRSCTFRGCASSPASVGTSPSSRLQGRSHHQRRALREGTAMTDGIKPGAIVHWGRSKNRYYVWVVRDGIARIADLFGNRNYGVPVDLLTLAADQGVPDSARRATAALEGATQ